MNILMISREIPPVGGGAGSVALNLASQLADHGHRVHILTMHFGDLPLIESRGSVTIQRLTCGRRHQDSAYFGSMLRFVLKARRTARSLAGTDPFDLVHAHAVVPDGVVAASVGRRRGVPVVITAHGSDIPGYDPERYRLLHYVLRPLWRGIVKRVDLLTSPSEYLRTLILKADEAAEVKVIPNGIDTDLLSGGAAQRSGFLIVSRLIERKNYHRFFEALTDIDDPQVIQVVGDGPELNRLHRIAATTHHQVTFHGWLEHGSDQWRHLYEHSRFFVFPSLKENFPINLLEAALAGLTVLASSIPGNREVLGEHAVYLDEPTPRAIAATIRDVLARSENELNELGRMATERIRRQFSWSTVAGQFMLEYTNLMEDHHDR